MPHVENGSWYSRRQVYDMYDMQPRTSCTGYGKEHNEGNNSKRISSDNKMDKVEGTIGDTAFTKSGSARAMYSAEYLSDMSRILNKSQTTKVMYSSDYPLKLVTNVNGVNIEFLLAPRIDQEV